VRTEPHWALTTWVLEKARVRSIRAHAAGLAPPPGYDDLEVGRLGVHAVGHLAALGARSAVARGAMLRKVSDWALTTWVLEKARVRSIRAHAAGLAPPPGYDEQDKSDG
jgi:hypothetical protein